MNPAEHTKERRRYGKTAAALKRARVLGIVLSGVRPLNPNTFPMTTCPISEPKNAEGTCLGSLPEVPPTSNGISSASSGGKVTQSLLTQS
jgi:hypothetical protein